MFRKIAIKIDRFAKKNEKFYVNLCWVWSCISFVLGVLILSLTFKTGGNNLWVSFLVPAVVLFPPFKFPWWARFLAIFGQLLTS